MIATATVETLSAEVRVLMVGSRQVTLSVYRQLDEVPADEIQPFGRVSDSKDVIPWEHQCVYVVGRSESGALVRSHCCVSKSPPPLGSVWMDSRRVGERRMTERRRDDWRSYRMPSGERRATNAYENRRRARVPNGRRRTLKHDNVYARRESETEYALRRDKWLSYVARYKELVALPLIVLAGLR